MKLTASNVAVTNTISVSSLTIGNNALVESVNIGNVSINSIAITVGNVSITPTVISTPQLIIGGQAFIGGLFSGIANYQEFTSSGTWYNPLANASANASLTGNEQVLVMAWGAGGGGTSNNTLRAGGGGGACVIGQYILGNLSNTVTVNVGSGGTASRTTTTALVAGGDGGTSAFGSLLAYGGGGGTSSASQIGGGGGGTLSAGVGGTTGVGGGPLQSNSTVTYSTYGGGSGIGAANGTASIFGGGAGGGSTTGNGGNSVFGGGGGCGGGGSVGGISIFGGNGGNTTVSATTPGGGGFANGTAAQAGARGEVRVWVFGPGATTVGAPTYTLTANTTTLYETKSILYTVSTTNIANNTTLYYTLNNASTATSAGFTTAVNGSVIISGGTGTFTLTAADTANTANQSFQMDIRTGNSTGSIVASNGSVSIIPSPAPIITGSAITSGSTTIVLSLPTGIVAGELLLVAVGDQDNRSFTWPAGWTKLDDQMNGNISAATIGYKIATGSEGSSITLVPDRATTVSSVALRISGAYITPPNISTVATGKSNSPDSGSVSLPVGSAGLYFAIAAGRTNSTTTLTSPPTGYTIANSVINNSSGGFCSVATKVSTTSPENPGAWTFSSATTPDWLAWTVAI